ncbi:hypothetical protein HAX54_019935 [Datura stramonium]|uniref:Uncharacterized protein n=1 Tax=Datura stramonium TaxID=4076 RepID=A0ABS8UQ10_DATST|nr:hypothetical protein [Datura stramonium]
MVIDEEDPSYSIFYLDTKTPPPVMEEIHEIGKKYLRNAKASTKGKQLSVTEEPSKVLSATVKKFKRKNIISKSSKGKQIVDEESEGMQELLEIVNYQGWEHLFELPMPNMYGSEVSAFYLSLTFTDEEETVYAKVVKSGGEPGELLDLQKENASLKSDNAALEKQLEGLTQQMLCDQRAANERIDKLLSKL